jgi:hypothetical protein
VQKSGVLELGFRPTALLAFFRSLGFRIHLLTRDATQLIEDDDAVDRILGPAGYAEILVHLLSPLICSPGSSNRFFSFRSCLEPSL